MSKEAQTFANDTHKSIINNSTKLPPDNVRCVRPSTDDCEEKRWLDMYNYYY